jgi:hypothetical protein
VEKASSALDLPIVSIPRLHPVPVRDLVEIRRGAGEGPVELKGLTMQKSIIALLLLGSAAAFANEAADEQVNRSSFVGERTRAEVKAEVLQAQRQGAVGVHLEYAAYLEQPSFSSGSDREAIRAEAVQAARTRVIQESI